MMADSFFSKADMNVASDTWNKKGRFLRMAGFVFSVTVVSYGMSASSLLALGRSSKVQRTKSNGSQWEFNRVKISGHIPQNRPTEVQIWIQSPQGLGKAGQDSDRIKRLCNCVGDFVIVLETL
ncbi:unnamed protein product [Natator depressus]